MPVLAGRLVSKPLKSTTLNFQILKKNENSSSQGSPSTRWEKMGRKRGKNQSLVLQIVLVFCINADLYGDYLIEESMWRKIKN